MSSETEGTKAKEPKPAVMLNKRGLTIRSVEELYRFANMACRSGAAPQVGKKPNRRPLNVEEVCMVVAFGLELGLGVMQSLYGVILSGRGGFSLYGDTARALVEASPDCEWVQDNLHELKADGSVDAVVSIQRRGRPRPVTRIFSMADAKAARLWGQQGPWTSYPARMLYYRALGFALRDAFPDVLKGLKTYEEIQDYPDELASGDVLPAKDLDDLAKTLEADVPGLVTPDPAGYEEDVKGSLTEEMAEGKTPDEAAEGE